METKFIFGNKVPSIINDPFQKSCITRVLLTATPKLFSENGEWEFKGEVNFTNGGTRGGQTITGENLADVFQKTMEFCMSLH